MEPFRPSIGRPRSFDEAEALDKATDVFWAHGYAGTSYPALELATGLHRQSLRYAFGDKAALFERVVEHYADRKIGSVAAMLNRPGAAIENVKSVFAVWTKDANHPSRRGCMMVNALAELGQADTVAAAAIDRGNQKLIAAFARALEIAKAQGAVRPDLDARVLASQAVALGDGFMVHSRSGHVAKLAEAAFAGFLRQIAT
jgi:TetR/AcrR family transcriptional regulator, transcriptional repressor for nem operon